MNSKFFKCLSIFSLIHILIAPVSINIWRTNSLTKMVTNTMEKNFRRPRHDSMFPYLTMWTMKILMSKLITSIANQILNRFCWNFNGCELIFCVNQANFMSNIRKISRLIIRIRIVISKISIRTLCIWRKFIIMILIRIITRSKASILYWIWKLANRIIRCITIIYWFS